MNRHEHDMTFSLPVNVIHFVQRRERKRERERARKTERKEKNFIVEPTDNTS
jgi:hypothetical protein